MTPPEAAPPAPPGRPDQPVEHVRLRSSPGAAWAALDEPEALCHALPGCESVEREAPDRFRAVLASKVAFVTVRVDVVARYEEVDRPRHLRLVMDGSPRGLSGSFHVEIPVDIAPTDDGGSDVAYSMDVAVEGSLRAIAGPAIEQGLRREFAQALLDLDARYAPAGESGREGDQTPMGDQATTVDEATTDT